MMEQVLCGDDIELIFDEARIIFIHVDDHTNEQNYHCRASLICTVKKELDMTLAGKNFKIFYFKILAQIIWIKNIIYGAREEEIKIELSGKFLPCLVSSL